MKIGHIDLDRDVLVVAEIGNNHEGSYALAEELIGLAADAGADAVKFQTIVPERLASSRDRKRIEQLRRLCLPYEAFETLSAVARDAGVLFLSTPFDLESVGVLAPLVPAFKIASGDNTFVPLIEAVARTGKPILLSTGMASMEQLRRLQTLIEGIWRTADRDPGLAMLHCVASYPVPPDQANLSVIPRLRDELGCVVGYSDHTLGIEAAALAVGLGARIVEKHFTLDKQYSDFRDHQLSADPAEMAELVRRIRQAELLLGSGEKTLQPCETALTTAARRSIAAVRDLPVGTQLCWDDITWVRPGDGIAPGLESTVLGRTLRRSLKAGESITLDMFDEGGNAETLGDGHESQGVADEECVASRDISARAASTRRD